LKLKLAWILATHPDAKLRDGAEAFRLATVATQVAGPADAAALDALAAAHAEAGEFTAAADAAKKAIELALAAKRDELAGQIQERLQLYESEHAFHEGETTQ
jgi:hypothetical protein